ncbi:MAG: hypothetical protein Q8S73_04955 [Deltaproteobacteria bacterium]|nr:hypothetical protein [Myxococcales bacterium]MDP3213428.1 hypothetical protein [Deltaproteobacteria bacterium]
MPRALRPTSQRSSSGDDRALTIVRRLVDWQRVPDLPRRPLDEVLFEV